MGAALSPDLLLRRIAVLNARKSHPELTPTELARLLRMPESSVRRTVKLLETPPKAMLEALGPDAVAAWMEAIPIASMKGDHRPAKDLLLHSRAIEPVQLQGQTSIAIIFAGAPGVPGLPSSSENDYVREIANESVVIDANVTDTSQGPSHAGKAGAATPERDPAPRPAKPPGIFPPET
jgi:hypothetical protein